MKIRRSHEIQFSLRKNLHVLYRISIVELKSKTFTCSCESHCLFKKVYRHVRGTKCLLHHRQSMKTWHLPTEPNLLLLRHRKHQAWKSRRLIVRCVHYRSCFYAAGNLFLNCFITMARWLCPHATLRAFSGRTREKQKERRCRFCQRRKFFNCRIIKMTKNSLPAARSR